MNPHMSFNSPWLSVEDCATAQHVIDTELGEMTPSPYPERARKLRARRNEYALINAWLPSELMVTIFYEVVITFQYGHIPQHRRRPGRRPIPIAVKSYGYNFSRTWTVISHICQSWRTIAVGTPQLWQKISLVNPDVTFIMLQRSQPSPICIDYHSPSPRPIDYNPRWGLVSALGIALAHSNRASEISLGMCWTRLQDLISAYLTKPMPLLKRLELRTGSRDEHSQDFLLPTGCLEGANALHCLVLADIGFSPTTILPTTLTKLHLHRLSKKFTPLQMTALLEPLENLCDLHIEDALRPDTPDPNLPPDLHCLSPRTHLTRLTISETARPRNELLARFSITSATQLNLLCTSRRLEDVHFGQLLRPIYGARGLVRSLSILCWHLLDMSPIITASGGTSSEIYFSLKVLPDSNGHILLRETLCDLCEMLPLDSVETLYFGNLDGRLEFGEVAAPLLASHLYGVRILRVDDRAVKPVSRVLHSSAHGSSPTLPSLGSLTENERDDTRDIDGLLHAITQCLVARKRSGKAADVEMLVLNGRIVPLGCLRNLESLRDWDGRLWHLLESTDEEPFQWSMMDLFYLTLDIEETLKLFVS